MRIVCLADGIPVTERPSTALSAHCWKLNRQREDMALLTIGVAKAVSASLSGKAGPWMVEHYIPDPLRDAMRREREEAEQLTAQRMQIARLMHMGERLNGRHHR